jgi:hypothetical protein
LCWPAIGLSKKRLPHALSVDHPTDVQNRTLEQGQVVKTRA